MCNFAIIIYLKSKYVCPDKKVAALSNTELDTDEVTTIHREKRNIKKAETSEHGHTRPERYKQERSNNRLQLLCF